ncbi:MAG: hypothetical protein QNJ73_17485 [Gammaproteobacteria bacterium]|nr:hypothetical protein [Gammaproteobacteria bacterium]
MLSELQDFLGRLNGIEVAADVRDFLVTDPDAIRRLEGPDARTSDEKLLLREAEGALEISLFLAPALLDRLDESNPLELLDHDNLADFCLALEGISHFNYLLWNASAGRSVTRLELEMQAEVDKYVSARVLANQADGCQFDGRLFGLLFDDPRFDSALSAEELHRYEHACRYASWYCRSLEIRFAAGLPEAAMLQELRQFFRLPQPDKLSHIHSAAFV